MSTSADYKVNQTQTVGISVPIGHIVVNSKWKENKLVLDLQASIPVHYEDSTSAIDFYPACKAGVIYISEADMVEGHAYKRRLARLRKANEVHGVVIVEQTDMSKQYFCDVQKFCISDLGLDLIPVANQNEAAAFLIQMVYVESSLNKNPFLKICQRPCKDTAILRTIGTCPGIGETKSHLILAKFQTPLTFAMGWKGSVYSCNSGYDTPNPDVKVPIYKFPEVEEECRPWVLCIPNKIVKELADIIGKASALKLYKFLHGL